MIRKILIFLSILLSGCGGSSGSSGEPPSKLVPEEILIDCLGGGNTGAPGRNCADADVDLIAPIQYAADNGINIVEVRWAGCCNDNRYFAVSAYAASLGISVIWTAGESGRILELNSPDILVVGGSSETSNTGNAIDVKPFTYCCVGSIHGATYETAVAVMLYDTYPKHEAQQRLMDGDYTGPPVNNYPASSDRWVTKQTVLIVDNGFDTIRPLYIVYKNTALAGQVTGDYGIKAINELYQWLDGVQVIGYVPFNTQPANPRIDGWPIN